MAKKKLKTTHTADSKAAAIDDQGYIVKTVRIPRLLPAPGPDANDKQKKRYARIVKVTARADLQFTKCEASAALSEALSNAYADDYGLLV